jgi:ABC-type dipeptide/oligopeptide/nickel transport system permease subunit
MRLEAYLGRRRRLAWHPGALLGGLLLAVIGLLVVLAPWATRYDPQAMEPGNQLAAPSSAHWLGTDPFGRDVWSRVLFGGRRTLLVAGAALAITVGGGLVLGLLTGYYGGLLDELVMRVVDVMLSFPGILLILVFVAMLGAGSRTLAVAVGVAGVPVFSRVVRSAVLVVRSEPYIEAAQSLGASHTRIMLRHILPNALGAIIAFSSVQFGWAILNASAMSFLGLGESPSIPEWGAMLNLGRGYLRDAPWASAAPGLAITLTVLAINVLGDALQKVFDPAL